MNVLITGGCGYIGSNLAKALLATGNEVRVLDDLSSGKSENIKFSSVDFIQGSILDDKTLTKAMDGIDIVYHLAALKSVSESVYKPVEYFEVNAWGTLQVLKAMLAREIKSVVFASSSSIYGQVSQSSISEDSQTTPLSPYGSSKLMAEELIRTTSKKFGLSSISLRYFNVVGNSRFGISDTSSFNLFPNILRSYETNMPLRVFGNNPNTQDGTCIRDYIHIHDVIEANLLAGKKCVKETINVELNVGLGLGYSVLQIIDKFQQKTGGRITLEMHQSRPGDPGTVIAATSKIREILSWSPNFELDDILDSLFLDKPRARAKWESLIE